VSSKETTFGRQELREKSIGRHVPWVAHIAPDIMIARNGSLIRTYRLDGVPQESVSDDEVNRWKDGHNNLLLSIQNPRCALWTHLVRRKVAATTRGVCETAFAKTLNKKYQENMAAADLYENALYLSVIIAPPQQAARSLLESLRGLFKDESSLSVSQSCLKEIEDTHLSIREAFSHYGPKPLTLYKESGQLYSEPLSFAAELVTGVPAKIPFDQREGSEAVSICRLKFGREVYRQRASGHEHYGGIISVSNYAQDTAPTELNNLLQLPFSFVLTQSFHFIEKTAATRAMELQINKMNNAGDHGRSQIEALDIALDQLNSNELSMGGHHMTLSTSAENPEKVSALLAKAQAALSSGAHVVAKREGLGTEAAFWAQIPGNSSYITRYAPVTSLNFAGMNVFHGEPSGRETGNHWGDAVTLLRTKNQTPYWFNFHHPKDLGNTILIGPSGEGKTVLALFLLAQLEKLNVTRVYFDKDRGAEIAIRAMGGKYSTLRKGESTGFNPCRCEDTVRNREFLREWLGMLARPTTGRLSATEQQSIDQAIDGLFTIPMETRCLSEVHSFIQGLGENSIRDRLGEWIGEGRLAWAFDNDDDHLDLEKALQGFDVTDFLEDQEVRTPILSYIFHRLDDVLDGRRVCIAFDEGWRLLDDDDFAAYFRAQLKTIRKKNGITFFATQEPHDILGTASAKTIISQSPTQIFLRNYGAQADDYCAGFGLSPQELRLIQTMPPRHFLIKQGAMVAVIDFALRDFEEEIAVLSGTAATNKLLGNLLEEYGDAPSDWLQPFHERRNK